MSILLLLFLMGPCDDDDASLSEMWVPDPARLLALPAMRGECWGVMCCCCCCCWSCC